MRKAFVTLGVFGRQRVGNHEDLASCERLGVQTLGERRDAVAVVAQEGPERCITALKRVKLW